MIVSFMDDGCINIERATHHLPEIVRKKRKRGGNVGHKCLLPIVKHSFKFGHSK